MRVLELFSGTGVLSATFREHGHETLTVDADMNVECDLHADVSKLEAPQIVALLGGAPDVVWASPDCTTYSVAAISKHRRREADGTLVGISDYARYCDLVNEYLVKQLIPQLAPKVFFIENPRGGLRKMPFMLDLPRYTITYCQYGEHRMKPTDIWTNHPDPKFRPPCKNGDACHEPVPRGSKSGTQRINGKLARAKLPRELCEHIVAICEELG